MIWTLRGSHFSYVAILLIINVFVKHHLLAVAEMLLQDPQPARHARADRFGQKF